MPKKKIIDEEEEDLEFEEEIDENDLTQLPDVDVSLAKKLKRIGYFRFGT